MEVKSDIRIEEQDSKSLSLPCTATGIPTPKIIWALNGRLVNLNIEEITVEFQAERISQVSVTPRVIIGTTNSTLVISNPRCPDHHGTYKCTGFNNAASNSSLFFDVFIYGNLLSSYIVITLHNS